VRNDLWTTAALQLKSEHTFEKRSTMTSKPDAPVQRRRLRSELRRARQEAGLTQKDVAEALEWSLSKLIRIEAGAVGISTTDLRALLQHYGVNDAEVVDHILNLARAGKEQRGWWTTYRDVISQQFLTFLGHENSASVILMFQPLLIPGLLQDEEYARALYRSSHESATSKRVEELVRLRLHRQEELFERPDPPEMVFVIDEAALRRWVGGRDVMRHQLRRLKGEALRDNVTVDVVPFTAGGHPGLFGPFVILEFADERDEDILFLENVRGDGGDIFRDEQMEIAPYRETFAQLRDLAHQTDLGTVVDRALKEMS
jgi:transcriptional regulator with XRE-family HTH domain